MLVAQICICISPLTVKHELTSPQGGDTPGRSSSDLLLTLDHFQNARTQFELLELLEQKDYSNRHLSLLR